jgi:hypothetical protein
MDRDPAFLEALMEQGRALAELFLPARAFIEGVWNEGNDRRRHAVAERLAAGAGPGGVFRQVEALHGDLAPLRVDVKHMAIKVSAGDRRQGPCGEVNLKDWTARGRHRRGGR